MGARSLSRAEVEAVLLEQAEAELKAATENLARGSGEPVKAGISVRKIKLCASSCGTQSKSRVLGEPYFTGFSTFQFWPVGNPPSPPKKLN
jgi:hypothetical protein